MVENVMKINGIKINVECKITNKKSRMEKHFIWNLSTCSCENDQYYYWVVKCDEIVEPTKNKTINFSDEKAACK